MDSFIHQEVTMAINRIQFQPGLSLNEFLNKYGTEPQCEAALEKARWPRGFICPGCHSTRHCVVWHGRAKTFQCSCCRRQITLRAGTIFHGSKLPLTTWFQAIYFLTQAKTTPRPWNSCDCSGFATELPGGSSTKSCRQCTSARKPPS